MRIAHVVIAILFSASMWAQTPTWSEDIAPILYENCTECHRQGGIAPFSLMSYSNAAAYAGWINTEVTAGNMPPWPPDTNYQRYAHERLLSQGQIQAITDWLVSGTPEGDTSLAPDPPVYTSQAFLSGTPDLTLTIPTYQSKAVFQDDYVCFALPSNIPTTKRIKAIEVIPGNINIVHHVLVYLDSSGTYQTDTIGGNCGGPGPNDDAKLAAGYAPGSSPMIFPNVGNMRAGVTMHANSNVILAMHYPEGSAGQWDSTQVNLFFYDDTIQNVREVFAEPLIVDWLFCILPNQISTLNQQYPDTGTIIGDWSMISVFPHMHLLGQKIKSYAVDVVGDTLRFVNVPKWDFEWQDFYMFDTLKRLTNGSVMYGEATYDNTPGNIHNPNSPPQMVCVGEATTDEMFVIYFQFMQYQPGDENISLEDMQFVGTREEPSITEQETVNVAAYPNPFTDAVRLRYTLERESPVTVTLHDFNGKQLQLIDQGTQGVGEYSLSMQGKDLAVGAYFYRLDAGGKVHIGKLVHQ